MSDGQDAGEMLLDIETRIGELAGKEKQAQPIKVVAKGHKGIIAIKPSGKPPKHERLGIPEKRMHQAQIIAKYPDIVEKVKARADIKQGHTLLYRPGRDRALSGLFVSRAG